MEPEQEQEEERQPVLAYLLKTGEFSPADNRRCDACGRHCPHGARGVVVLGFTYSELCRRCWRVSGERIGEATEFAARVRSESKADAFDEAATMAAEFIDILGSLIPPGRRRFRRAELECDLEVAFKAVVERLRAHARSLRVSDQSARSEAGS